MVVNLIKMDFPQFSIFQTNKITHVKSTVLLNLENLLPVLFFRLFSINIDRNPLLFVAFQPFYIFLFLSPVLLFHISLHLHTFLLFALPPQRRP